MQPRAPLASVKIPELPTIQFDELAETIVATQFFGRSANDPHAEKVHPSIDVSKIQVKGILLDRYSGHAMISVAGQPQQDFAIGDTVTSGAILERVEPDRIFLRAGTSSVVAMLEDSDTPPLIRYAESEIPAGLSQPGSSKTPKKVLPKKIYLSRAEISGQVRNPHELLSQLSVVPQKGGGFLVQDVKAGSVAEQFGLQPGDVVHKIGDVSINYADDIMRAYRESKEKTKVTAELERNGQKSSLIYEVN